MTPNQQSGVPKVESHVRKNWMRAKAENQVANDADWIGTESKKAKASDMVWE